MALWLLDHITVDCPSTTFTTFTSTLSVPSGKVGFTTNVSDFKTGCDVVVSVCSTVVSCVVVSSTIGCVVVSVCFSVVVSFLPILTTILIAVPSETSSPYAMLCSITLPSSTVSLSVLLTLPTDKPSDLILFLASFSLSPIK